MRRTNDENRFVILRTEGPTIVSGLFRGVVPALSPTLYPTLYPPYTCLKLLINIDMSITIGVNMENRGETGQDEDVVRPILKTGGYMENAVPVEPCTHLPRM